MNNEEVVEKIQKLRHSLFIQAWLYKEYHSNVDLPEFEKNSKELLGLQCQYPEVSKETDEKKEYYMHWHDWDGKIESVQTHVRQKPVIAKQPLKKKQGGLF